MMQKNIPGNRSWKFPVYHIAKVTWAITAWIWAAIILVFLLNFIPSILTAQDPNKTWAYLVIQPLFAPMSGHEWDFLRVFAASATISFIVITFLALLFKQTLQSQAHPEGFRKLIQLLEQNALSPHVEKLNMSLGYQLVRLDKVIEKLSHVNLQMQQMPNSNNLYSIYEILQNQLILQKKFLHILQTQQPLSQQAALSAQLQQLSDLYKEEQKIQRTISIDLQRIFLSLDEMLDKFDMVISLIKDDDSFRPDQRTMTDRFPAIGTSPQSSQLRNLEATSTKDDTQSADS